MATLKALFNSDNDLVATLTDESGDPVTGATLTVTLVDPDGSEVVADASMSEDGSGEYSYRIGPDVLTQNNAWYTAKVTAEASGNQRYAEVPILNETDDD